MQDDHHESPCFRKSLELILSDISSDFHSKVHDLVLPFKYGKEDGKVSHREDQAKKLADKCVDCTTNIISRRFAMIVSEWPYVFAAYTKISDKIPNLVKEGFIVLAAWRRVDCSEIVTEQVRNAHKVGRFFLDDFEFYQNRLANEALESRLHSSIAPIIHELSMLILGKGEQADSTEGAS